MEQTKRLCPLCSIELLQLPMGDRAVDMCEKCQGMFFELDELAPILRQPVYESFTDIAYGDGAPDRTSELSCPKCGDAMQEMEYADSKIHIDHCESCQGLFLDRGEQDEIRNYLASVESPDVLAAKEERMEKSYQEKMVAFAQKLLDDVRKHR